MNMEWRESVTASPVDKNGGSGEPPGKIRAHKALR
jgi:hypothetical protein